jgi:hypothetical protein
MAPACNVQMIRLSLDKILDFIILPLIRLGSQGTKRHLEIHGLSSRAPCNPLADLLSGFTRHWWDRCRASELQGRHSEMVSLLVDSRNLVWHRCHGGILCSRD